MLSLVNWNFGNKFQGNLDTKYFEQAMLWTYHRNMVAILSHFFFSFTASLSPRCRKRKEERSHTRMCLPCHHRTMPRRNLDSCRNRKWRTSTIRYPAGNTVKHWNGNGVIFTKCWSLHDCTGVTSNENVVKMTFPFQATWITGRKKYRVIKITWYFFLTVIHKWHPKASPQGWCWRHENITWLFVKRTRRLWYMFRTQKDSYVGLWRFLFLLAWIGCWTNSGVTCDLRRLGFVL